MRDVSVPSLEGAASAASFFSRRDIPNRDVINGAMVIVGVHQHLYPETIEAGAHMAHHLAQFFSEIAYVLDEELVMRGLK